MAVRDLAQPLDRRIGLGPRDELIAARDALDGQAAAFGGQLCLQVTCELDHVWLFAVHDGGQARERQGIARSKQHGLKRRLAAQFRLTVGFILFHPLALSFRSARQW